MSIKRTLLRFSFVFLLIASFVVFGPMPPTAAQDGGEEELAPVLMTLPDPLNLLTLKQARW